MDKSINRRLKDGKYVYTSALLFKSNGRLRRYWYVKFFLGLRQIEKKIKLNIFLASENNSNILAPILGQYGIKPSDFILKLKDNFLSNVLLNKGAVQENDIDLLLKNLIFSFILSIGKNNVYSIIFKKFANVFLYNVFLQRKKGIFLNVLFLFKMQYMYGNKNKILFFLMKRLLVIRLITYYSFFLLLLSIFFFFSGWVKACVNWVKKIFDLIFGILGLLLWSRDIKKAVKLAWVELLQFLPDFYRKDIFNKRNLINFIFAILIAVNFVLVGELIIPGFSLLFNRFLEIIGLLDFKNDLSFSIHDTCARIKKLSEPYFWQYKLLFILRPLYPIITYEDCRQDWIKLWYKKRYDHLILSSLIYYAYERLVLLAQKEAWYKIGKGLVIFYLGSFWFLTGIVLGRTLITLLKVVLF